MKRLTFWAISLLAICSSYAQSGIYESCEIIEAYKKGTRSSIGVPGLNYWQNTVTYDLKAVLDAENKVLNGTARITFFNNSPDSLRYIIIKLLPNINKKGAARDYAFQSDQLSDGLVIDRMSINGVGQDLDNRRKFREYGTNLYVVFGRSHPVLPGSETEFYIDYNFELISKGLRNGAYCDSAYFIGYWYPQIAVYDDIYGWDREEYTGKQEAYNELGNYHVEITVPDDYVVWATGDHLNEKETFSSHTLGLIKESRSSGKSIHIITESSYEHDIVLRKDHSNTWIYEANDVPDFAWACSNYYLWDANSLRLDDHDVWISAVYPSNTRSFNKIADVAHQCIDYLSNEFPGVPYPFNKHITFNGIHYIGVEYPMMANNGDHEGMEMYNELTIHEIAHNYIPFFMLSNERKHAWIDEGWVKLIGELHGESLGIPREEKEALNTLHVYENTAGTSNDLPLIIPSSNMTTAYNFYHSYAKAANSNLFLMELMKEKGVDNPLKEFLLTWKGKHPTPYDFFNFMNYQCGEDLSWYWNPWYFEFSAPDQELLKGSDNSKVIVKNKGGIPLPVMLTITYTDDHVEIIDKSIWSWSKNRDALIIDIPDYNNARSITLGAPGIPDCDKKNNELLL